jgi:hypothetical protein
VLSEHDYTAAGGSSNFSIALGRVACPSQEPDKIFLVLDAITIMGGVVQHMDYGQRLIQVSEVEFSCGAEEKLPVLAGSELLLKPAYAAENVRTNHESRGFHRQFLEKAQIHGALRNDQMTACRGVLVQKLGEHRQGPRKGTGFDVTATPYEVGEGELGSRRTSHDVELLGELVGSPFIVRVQESDELPRAAARPVLRAAATPRLTLCRNTLIRGSLKDSRTACVSSVDPSSTTMSSQSGYVWPSTLRMARSKQ